MTRLLVVAGPASGVGKTSITLGLLEALRRRGLRVQAFKIGPDFIDTGLHAAVTGRPSYNLDAWMCGRARVLASVARRAADADVAVIEGVMGCFDGVGGTSDAGSTAQLAKWLGAAVLLVIDAGAQSRSAAATVLGFERFDPALRLVAVVANRVGGATHARWVTDAIRRACRAEPVGSIPWDSALALPERHLGLFTAAEGALSPDLVRRLGDTVERHVDLDRLLSLAVHRGRRPKKQRLLPDGHRAPRARIGVAWDEAFQFYYAENLELLRSAGAELVFWSPVHDGRVPDVDGLYLGGGYPELHAAALAANGGVLKDVQAFAERERPIYAECGGLMFLAESLEDLDGRVHGMVGLLPARVRMAPRHLTLRYVDVELARPTLLGPAGSRARGHEFHASTLDPVPGSVRRAYRLRSPDGSARALEGYAVGRALMSYVHLHFGANPALARAFVEACAETRA